MHDSGGFETGGETAVAEVKRFIREKRSKPLAEQIHCIWCCIDSSSPSPIQPIDTRFFSGEFDTGEIPIFVIFTKYDKLIDAVRESEDAPESEKVVEKLAFEHFDSNLGGHVMQLAEYDPKIKICRTAIKNGQEVFPKHCKDAGVFSHNVAFSDRGS